MDGLLGLAKVTWQRQRVLYISVGKQKRRRKCLSRVWAVEKVSRKMCRMIGNGNMVG